ncbi:serpin-type proteinase inhibitor 6 [Vairimorpha necatrix]|uniref:Serpin-type proteinase inhibitor 6 n=1 Tax=Vairimorpha necatrix TaxID=6039 RepID=A0AAX4JGP7_9MICR
MMLDTSNNIFNHMLQESDSTFVFSCLSVINLLWVYFNVFDNLARHEYLEFSHEDDIECRIIYNDEFRNLSFKLRNIFESSHWYKLQSEGFVYVNNFVFYNKDLKLIEEDVNPVLKSSNVKIHEFDPEITSEDLTQLIIQTVDCETKWKVNKLKKIIPFSLELVEEIFYINKNKEIKIPMMQKTEKMFKYETNDFIAIGMHLNIYCMNFIAVLPKNDISLIDVHKFITGDNRNGLHDMMEESTEHVINLKMPKFKIESKFDLLAEMKTNIAKENLEEKKVNEKFIKLGNFFLDSKNDFEHIAMVDINEQGIKEVELKWNQYIPRSDSIKEITLNRPFLFYIVENMPLDEESTQFSNVPIFMGRYSGENN